MYRQAVRPSLGRKKKDPEWLSLVRGRREELLLGSVARAVKKNLRGRRGSEQD